MLALATLSIVILEASGHRIEGMSEPDHRRRSVLANADGIVTGGHTIGGVHHGGERRAHPAERAQIKSGHGY